jgi:hypothetical protein
MPNGPAGLNAGVKYGITGDPAYGDTVANLPARTQDAIKAELKANNIASGHSVWTNNSGPFAALKALFGVSGKGPFEALAHRLGQALLGQPISHIWSDIEHLFTDLGNIPLTLTEHTEAIANLNDITAAMNTTAAYVGDQQDMVSVPRCLLAVTGPNGYKAWEVGTPITIVGAATLNTDILPVIYPRTYPFATRGDIYWTPIVVDRHGTIDKIRWIVGADTSILSIDFYEVALCAYNPANGNVEKVWSSGNVVDGVANTSSLQEVEISMGLSQSVTPGQILFVAHQQVGPGLGQSPRAFAAAPQAGIARPSTLLLDASCYRKTNYTKGIPSSISFSSLGRVNGFIPWAGVSVHA